MDAHTDTAAVEAPVAEVTSAIESLPSEESVESSQSFMEAIDQALSPQAVTPVAEEAPQEPVEEPKEEPVEEVKEEPTEETSEESTDPIEQLTENFGDDWTPKAANRFKELKSELKSNRSELEELRQLSKEQTSKLEEMAALVENKDIDSLQQQIEQYETQKAFTDLESTEAYIENITKPINELMDEASNISDHYDVDNEVLIDIMGLEDADEQDAALDKFFPEMSSRDKAKVYRIIDAVDPILQNRQNMIDNVDVALNEAKALEEQRQSAELAEKVQLRQNVTKNVVQRVQEKLPFLAGIEDINLSEIQEKASELDPTVVHPVDFAYGAVAAELLPKIVRQYFSSQKEVDSLMDKLSQYEEAEPTMSGTPATDKPNASNVNDGMSFEDAIAAAFN
jgi:hypothetical protein